MTKLLHLQQTKLYKFEQKLYFEGQRISDILVRCTFGGFVALWLICGFS